ncbi:MAG: nif-specific transcriptional activator NifA [Acidobacteriaceae bacterium]
MENVSLRVSNESESSVRHEVVEPASVRTHAALMGIYEISKVLTRPARLETALSGVVNLLHSFMDMSGGLIALLDEEDRASTVVGAGWNETQAREHFERLPEQAVGQIVVSGMPLVVRDVAQSRLFEQWSELKTEDAAALRSFVGVPIKGENRTIGTLTIVRVGSQSSPGTLDEDVRYLTMIANLVGQTVALQSMVERDRERLLAERNRLEEELEQKNATRHEGISWIIGKSPAILEVTEKVQLVARCNLPVLLCGESGTGKELFARAIHEYSPRKEQPYIRLNCAALSESVLESELFGHDRGAFTGAIGMRKGRFEMADGGTLFLDEIGEISSTFQAKLLRVLQEGEFERVGGNHTIKVDVRLVTATNRNLEAAVISGDFRSDLYYRISVVPIFLPPLRERREDIPLLAREFLKRFNKEHGVSLNISPRAMEVLTAYDFPGNVRELESCVRRTAALTKNPMLQAEDFVLGNESSAKALDRSMTGKRPPGGGTRVFPALPTNGGEQAVQPGTGEREEGPSAEISNEGEFGERERLVDAMERAGWVQAKAARLLGLTPRQMGYALRKHAIEIKRF